MRWKLLDFNELKQSSVSFFDAQKPESASRWSIANMRPSRPGKVLSEDAKAKKLALQNWLEAIDPRHCYGRNLHIYYVSWLQCQSEQLFFYWLDVGDGKEVNLERCPRSKLLQQCIKYLGPIERQAYEVMVMNQKFVYKQSGKLVDTTDSEWIFVLSASKKLYVGKKVKGKFEHSSFLAGGATLCAGRLAVEDGILKAIWPHCGFNPQTEEISQEFVSRLLALNIGVTDARVRTNCQTEKQAFILETNRTRINYNQLDAGLYENSEVINVGSLTCGTTDSRQKYFIDAKNADLDTSTMSLTFCSKITGPDIATRGDVLDIFKQAEFRPECGTGTGTEPFESTMVDGCVLAQDSFLTEEDCINLDQENTDSGQNDFNAAESADPQTSKLSLRLGSNITRLEIPSKYNLLYSLKQEDVGPSCQPQPPSSPLEDGYISAEDSLFTEEDFMFPKYNLFDNDDEGDEEPIPKKVIMRRIDSHKGIESYQLAKQLSSKWATGAGPRIGCIRDYPYVLQFRVLEQAQLFPRPTNANSSPQNASRFTPGVSSPTSTRR